MACNRDIFTFTILNLHSLARRRLLKHEAEKTAWTDEPLCITERMEIEKVLISQSASSFFFFFFLPLFSDPELGFPCCYILT
jgi:hypothetical protein